MRILIYSYNYHPEPIGIAPLMTELAEGLVKRGHDVRVITAMPNYPQREIYEGYRGKLYLTEHKNGVIVDRCYVRIRPKPNLLDRLLLEASFVATSFLKALSSPRPDIIILTSPPLLVSLPAAILGWIHRTPVILNLQDILPEAAIKVGLLSNQALIRALEVVEMFAYRTVTKISVIADGFADNLRSKGVPSSKIVKITNWVDVNFIRPLPKENNSFRTAHHLNGKFVILYCGNIALTQGLETLIKAASRVRHVRDIVILIVGEEKALGRLKHCCKTWDANNVKLLPFQPREKLPEMLSAADVGLVIQKHNVISFNMPSKIQVLLASGRPILASVPAHGTAARAVKKSGGGIVVPPEDPETLAAKILELYNDPATVTLLGNRSRQHALQYYSFDQALNRYEELFSEIQNKRLLAAVQKS